MSTKTEMNARQAVEWQAQERAFERLRQGQAARDGDGRADTYQVLFQAIAGAPRSEPPADFVQLALRSVREAEVDEYIERWLLRLAGLMALVGVAVFAGPAVWSSLSTGMAGSLGPAAGVLSSPLLWTAVAAGVTALGCDGWAQRRHDDGGTAPG